MASKLGCRVDLFGKLAYKCAASICFLLLFDSSRDTRYLLAPTGARARAGESHIFVSHRGGSHAVCAPSHSRV